MYTKILVPLDGSKLAECVMPYLKWFTQVSKVNEIVLLRAVEKFRISGGLEGNIVPEEREHIERDLEKQASDYLRKIADEELKETGVKVTPVVIEGKPAKAVADYVRTCDVDLIVMATHGFSGFHRWVSGSVADEILHAAQVPVFMVKPQDRPPDK
jgi:nucleotide-binding universal stress UspA family protein